MSERPTAVTVHYIINVTEDVSSSSHCFRHIFFLWDVSLSYGIVIVTLDFWRYVRMQAIPCMYWSNILSKQLELRGKRLSFIRLRRAECVCALVMSARFVLLNLFILYSGLFGYHDMQIY